MVVEVILLAGVAGQPTDRSCRHAPCPLHSRDENYRGKTKAGSLQRKCFRTLSGCVTAKDVPSAAGETNQAVLT